MDYWARIIERTPVLTPEEEREIIPKARCGDSDALRRLVEANLRWVIHVAYRYYIQYERHLLASFADLVQEGCIGLIHALQRFEPHRGFRFITYAHHWVQLHIENAVHRNLSLLSLTPSTGKVAAHLRTAYLTLRLRLGRTPTFEELSAEAGVSPTAAAELSAVDLEVISLDEPIYDDEGTSEFIVDTIPASESELPEHVFFRGRLQEALIRALSQLTPREREVVMHRFGLQGKEMLSLAELAQRYRVSRQRIRYLEQRALRKLRACRELQQLWSDMF